MMWRGVFHQGARRFFSAALVVGAVGLSCADAPLTAMRFGSGEALAATGAFEAVGRLECRAAEGRARVRDATGWIVGSADTVVTAAHSLFVDGVAIDPRRCVFRLLNRDGSVRETARLRYVRSLWMDDRRRNDSAYDVAVIKLDRRMAVAQVAAAVAARPAGRPVKLISFPADAPSGGARISSGEARPFPYRIAQDDAGMRVTDPSRLFASSADSAAGSSGGMYYAPGAHAAVGLHLGYLCAADDCFNIGLRFDADLLAMIAEVAGARTPDGGERLASAEAASVRALR